MTKQDCSMEEIMQRLQAPFPQKDIEWRVSRSGTNNKGSWAMVLAYVTNRAIQNRLDEVFGPAGWKNDYRDFMQGILCTITCHINGEWVSKSDGAEQTQFESLKGGLSGAMKRAAVQWGIGRYLYNLEEQFVEVSPNKSNGSIYINDEKKKVKGYWIPPKLPNFALPENERSGQKKNSKQPNQSYSQNTKAQKKQESNHGHNGKPQTNPNKGFNRAGAVKAIGEFLVNTGLMEQKEFIMPLFKRINPKIQQSTLEDVSKYATEEELRNYAMVLRPVNDLVNLVNFHKVSMDYVLQNYVQMLCPETTIKNLFSCFMHLSLENVREINAFIKEEKQQKTA